jgi:hypothetical protein
MALENMSLEQVDDAINEVGETGSWKLEGSGLYTKGEENQSWLFVGTVEDVEEANELLELRRNT